jgi:hypothetical protein
MTSIKGTLGEEIRTFVTVSRSILERMGNVLNKFV